MLRPELVTMAFNFRACDRDQVFLMPPSVADWLEPDHLVWFLIDAVDQMDLAAMHAAYRRDGRGGAAFDPSMMVALLLYAYAVGERSTRKIERHCQLDVAFRVLCANQQPDHTTIARFRRQHHELLEQLFVESVRMCADAGLAQVSTVAVDGRKISANASINQSRNRESIEREVKRWFEESDAIDAAEDAEFGVGNSGPEVPKELKTRKGRIEAIRRAKAKFAAEDAQQKAEHDARIARREEYIARHGRAPEGRPPTGRARKDTHINLTDPDSRMVRRHGGVIQGFNTQAVVSEDQIVIGAAVVDSSNDQAQLTPMINVAQHTLRNAGVTTPIRTVLADAGYGTNSELAHAEQDPHSPELFIATGHRRRRDGTVDPDTPRGRMHDKLLTDAGQRTYTKRCHIVEPVFGQHHIVQRFDRFSLRGFTAVNAEFKLVNAAHNLLKLWRHTNRTRTTALA